MVINTTTYDKSKAIPYNPNKACGYQPRNKPPRSILVHTTNGKAGSTLKSEAEYIMNSLRISAHFLIGKQGEIIQILDPRYWMAYHAGCVIDPLWSNTYSIGIEMHNTPAEGHITTQMYDSLDWLVRKLMQDFNITNTFINTHRAVAIFCSNQPNAGKLGRKIDPSGFPDNEFHTWRKSLAVTPFMRFRVNNVRGVYIRQSPQVNSNNIAGTLQYNDEFISDVLKDDELDQVINGTNKWAHILKGTSQGKPVDQLGFVHASNLILLN